MNRMQKEKYDKRLRKDTVLTPPVVTKNISESNKQIIIPETTDAMHTEPPPPAGTTKIHGGIRRTSYWMGKIVILVILFFLDIASQSPVSDLDYALFFTGVVYILMVVLALNRLHNIGMSGVWSLFIIVPIVNLFIDFRCSIYPEGYQDTKIFDFGEKIMTGIWLIISSIFTIYIFHT